MGLQRVSIWADLALGWGLLYPPLALTGLLYVMLEQWCYVNATTRLNIGAGGNQQRCQAPREVLMFWFMVSNMFAAGHFASNIADPPHQLLAAMVPILIMISWFAGIQLQSNEILTEAPVGEA